MTSSPIQLTPDLRGRTALVTGASSGIGAGIARGLAMAGASVVINYLHHEPRAREIAKSIEALGAQALIVHADVSRADQVEAMFSAAIDRFGRLDILVNNAGISVKRPFCSTDEALWDRIIDTNLKSVYLCCKQAVRLMKDGGAILNISSVHARLSTYNFSVYAASKGGMESLTRNLAIEFGERGIRVNAIRPGFIVVENEPYEPANPDYPLSVERFPIKRLGEVADVVPTAVLLCSPLAGLITGCVIPIDGGMGIQANTPFPRGFIKEGAWQDA